MLLSVRRQFIVLRHFSMQALTLGPESKVPLRALTSSSWSEVHSGDCDLTLVTKISAFISLLFREKEIEVGKIGGE